MYSISEVAKLSKLTARTLRHYEDKGLIICSHRGNNGYRYFGEFMSKLLKESLEYLSIGRTRYKFDSNLNL